MVSIKNKDDQRQWFQDYFKKHRTSYSLFYFIYTRPVLSQDVFYTVLSSIDSSCCNTSWFAVGAEIVVAMTRAAATHFHIPAFF
jgi:hypothetical protein